tara:strand:- start:930 stop:2000 length:1071 start_codon:yes stop_codon:yes gene_type:complete
MKTKIIYLTAQKIPTIKAHSVQILKMCEGFSNFFKTTLICGKTSNRYYFKNKKKIKIKYFKYSNNRIILLIQKLFLTLLIFRKKNILYYTRDIHFAFILSIFTNQKIFLELHYPYINKNLLSYHLLKLIFRKINIKLIFISKSLFIIYKKNFKNIRNRYTIAHDASENFKSLSPKKKIINVGYSGHLYNGRGIPLIIKLAEKFKDFNFNIAGGDKKLLSYYRGKTIKIKNLKFFGHIPHNSLKNFFSLNHILIAPYENKVTLGNNIETSSFMSPLKIFEYMSSKKPFISSNHKVLREVLVHNKNCLLCSPGNIDDWTNALIRLKSSKLRKRLSNQSYKDFKLNYNWKMRVKKVLDL